MSNESNFRKMYLILPLVIGLSSCSLTKNMVIVNSPNYMKHNLADDVNVSCANYVEQSNYEKYLPYQNSMMNNKPDSTKYSNQPK